MVRSVVVALLPVIVSAALCTETDFMPLTTVLVACATVSGMPPTALQSTPSTGDIARLCQFPQCKGFFMSLASLKCNDANGVPLASSSGVCNGVVAGPAASTTKPSTGSSPSTTVAGTTTSAPKPFATSSGLVAVASACALAVVAAAVNL
ncbi:hypothetical protein H310_14661 [Aphanomyces invadans]|uniref:Uncharacterized protein n=1 Tax=Aphanomyces invadans TaxID=157072 RepID=A0A024T8V7_9STRA|nr:hypothetical protein H310_14661 [Aphanomyces invadans]ETV90595.1 hypothetical protein H310_14661 [Aphanomyces invadans]|eukprot:XP_008880781.1 hypothetical protein H310_14661 [Aphanomyces invadans]